MLESIEKLRELRGAVEANDVDNPIWVCSKATMIADEIEREISERYISLPVDADGVPTHMGDTVEGELPDNTTVKGVVTTYHIHDNGEPDTVYIKVDCGGGAWTIKELKVKHCRHVKPDSLKELLDDVSKGAVGYPRERVTGYLEDNHSLGEAVMLDVRDRLRELLGGDSE